MTTARTSETWQAWLIRQRDNPDSGVAQLMAEGLSLDTAVLVIMLGKVHNELCDMADGPPEEWRS